MLSRQQSREADHFAIHGLKIPGILLMENAGRGCAEWLLSLGCGNGVVIACGAGNNGGDGFVIARHLFNANVRTKVVLLAAPESYRGDARANLRIVERLDIPVIEFDQRWDDIQLHQQLTKIERVNASWIVDAILGTGATGCLRDPLERVVRAINRASRKRMAIDCPTGMDCDTGEVNPTAVRADVTCTMIDRKLGFANSSAAEFLGHVTVVGIGAPNS
jgi:NAD(P)H-hydrate epimerase